MFKIKVKYKVYNYREIYTEIIHLSWKNLEVVKENIERIKNHIDKVKVGYEELFLKDDNGMLRHVDHTWAYYRHTPLKIEAFIDLPSIEL